MTGIALSRIAPLYGATVSPNSGGIFIVTDPRPWAHSAEVELKIPEIENKSQKISVRLRIESGVIGIGWLESQENGWVTHVVIRPVKNGCLLEIPAGTVGGRLVFNNQREDGKPSRVLIQHIAVVEPVEDDYRAALAAEERGDTEMALALYKAVLSNDPSHTSAIAGLGRLRYVDPPQPVLEEMRRWRPADAIFHVMIEIRNPCNYRCFYCISAGRNNTPVERFDFDRIEELYRQIHAQTIITSFECDGGEPTVHPEFPELLRLSSRYGFVSFPTNNSQNPRRWLPLEAASRIYIRAALHPEGEKSLDRYLENAEYLIGAGCKFNSRFIAHPEQVPKYEQYKELFHQRGVPFWPIPFSGEYNRKPYPQSYTESEKQLMGLNDRDTHWTARINPDVTRIRNFRGIPCNAGYRSVCIKSDGTVLRCSFDRERFLQSLLTEPEICGVNNCGCMLQLEKLDQVQIDADFWVSMFEMDIDQPSYDWIRSMKTNCAQLIDAKGYKQASDAIAIEATSVYDALMVAYGKEEFPE